MISLSPVGLNGNQFTEDMFGANFLATSDRIGEGTNYANTADYLGVDLITFPGGALTEAYFDITNPDSTEASAPIRELTINLEPYSHFMEYAEASGKSVIVKLPTKCYLSDDKDALGHRYADVDEDALRTFIRDTLDGKYGSPEIRGFEIGNEYWGSGKMTTPEYGRIASKMAETIHDEIKNHPDFQNGEQEPDVIVQIGLNYGPTPLSSFYADYETGQEVIDALNEDFGLDLDKSYLYQSGKPRWADINNKVLIAEFDTDEARDAVSGVSMHLYSRGEDTPGSRYFELDLVNKYWVPEFDHAHPVVTEWNTKVSSRDFDKTTDSALVQSHEMLNIVEAMSLYNTEAATVWPLQIDGPSGLAGNEFSPGIRVAGEMFRLMDGSLVGTTPVDLNTEDSKEGELTVDGIDVHMFAAPDKAVFFIVNTTESDTMTDINLSSVFKNMGDVTVTRLGVMPGDAPGDTNAEAQITEIPSSQVLDGRILSADLDPREIMRVVIEKPVYTVNATNAFDFENLIFTDNDEIDPTLTQSGVLTLGGATVITAPSTPRDLVIEPPQAQIEAPRVVETPAPAAIEADPIVAEPIVTPQPVTGPIVTGTLVPGPIVTAPVVPDPVPADTSATDTSSTDPIPAEPTKPEEAETPSGETSVTAILKPGPAGLPSRPLPPADQDTDTATDEDPAPNLNDKVSALREAMLAKFSFGTRIAMQHTASSATDDAGQDNEPAPNASTETTSQPQQLEPTESVFSLPLIPMVEEDEPKFDDEEDDTANNDPDGIGDTIAAIISMPIFPLLGFAF